MTTATTSNGHGSGPGRVVPIDAPIASEDAERGVLGALLLHNDPRMTLRLLNRVELSPDCFYWETHGYIFAALVALARAQIGGDEITIYAEMERRGTASSSARELLRVLPSYVPAAGNYVEYGEHVVELARWRERRRVAQEMLAAIGRRSDEDWQRAARVFLPDPEPQHEDDVQSGPRTLRLVDEHGSVVGEKVHCDGCERLEVQLQGAQTEIAGWRVRYANLKNDREKAARENAWWLPAQALFEVWKKEANHPRSKWSPARFEEAEPILRKHGVEMFARAIAGLTYDPYTKIRRNGTVQRFDSWETLCKPGTFEEYANRAPKGWKFNLNITGGVVEEEARAPQLAVVEEAS